MEQLPPHSRAMLYSPPWYMSTSLAVVFTPSQPENPAATLRLSVCSDDVPSRIWTCGPRVEVENMEIRATGVQGGAKGEVEGRPWRGQGGVEVEEVLHCDVYRVVLHMMMR